jgi:hypothetical protein
MATSGGRAILEYVAATGPRAVTRKRRQNRFIHQRETRREKNAANLIHRSPLCSKRNARADQIEWRISGKQLKVYSRSVPLTTLIEFVWERHRFFSAQNK